jgi:hypothetical protein
MEPRGLVANIHGGMGKAIASTAFLKAWHEQNEGKPVHVVGSYPDIYRGLPFIQRTYPLGQPIPYFRDGHEDFDVFSMEPYHRLAYRQGEEHLVDAYCNLAGINPPEDKRPVIKLTDQEHQAAMGLMGQMDRSKKWVAFQPFGGTSFHQPDAAMDPLRPRQVRDLPRDVAQGIVDRLVERGAIVIQVGLPTEPRLEKTVPLVITDKEGRPQIVHPRLVVAVLNLCERFLGVDSCGHHAWAALGKPEGSSVVLWGATNPANLSYPCHRDLVLEACETPNCGRPDRALGDIVDGNNVWRCPHGGACMNHNPDRVVEALMET